VPLSVCPSVCPYVRPSVFMPDASTHKQVSHRNACHRILRRSLYQRPTLEQALRSLLTHRLLESYTSPVLSLPMLSLPLLSFPPFGFPFLCRLPGSFRFGNVWPRHFPIHLLSLQLLPDRVLDPSNARSMHATVINQSNRGMHCH
jgi:hypothetical protein